MPSDTRPVIYVRASPSLYARAKAVLLEGETLPRLVLTLLETEVRRRELAALRAARDARVEAAHVDATDRGSLELYDTPDRGATR